MITHRMMIPKFKHKKVLLHERKRYPARRVLLSISRVGGGRVPTYLGRGGGGVPGLDRRGTYPGWGVPTLGR